MPHHDGSTTYAKGTCCDTSWGWPASRRSFLQGGATLAAAGAVTPLLPATSIAQTADPELTRLAGARRVLIKGGVVLTLDRQVGDFAQADVLIEDGRIRELRPSIAVSGDDTAIVDGANHILIPGFVDTHCHSYQGLLRGVLANGLLNPDYNQIVQNTVTPAYQAADAYAGMLVTALGMIDTGTTAIVDISQVSHSPEHSDALIRARQRTSGAISAGHQAAGADVFQLARPAPAARLHHQSHRAHVRAGARGRRP